MAALVLGSPRGRTVHALESRCERPVPTPAARAAAPTFLWHNNCRENTSRV